MKKYCTPLLLNVQKKLGPFHPEYAKKKNMRRDRWLVNLLHSLGFHFARSYWFTLNKLMIIILFDNLFIDASVTWRLGV